MAESAVSLAGKKCLVFGGAGNLGSNIIQLLLDRKASCASFDRVASPLEGVKSTIGDICDLAAVQAAVEGIDIVFHTASIIDIRPVPSPSMERINVDGTRNVVVACQKVGVKALIYTSSMEVVSGYLAGSRELPDFLDSDESTPIPEKHVLSYARTKAKAEALVLAACSGIMPTVALRPGYIVGPGCIGLKIEMEKAVERSNYYMTAKIATRMNCVHVKNCAMAHVLAAERTASPKVAGQSFFIGDFQDNVTDLGVAALKDTSVIPVILPLWFAWAMGFVMDRAYRLAFLLFGLFGKTLEIPTTVVDIHAVGLAWRNLCFSTQRSREVLGYGSTPDFVSKEDTYRQQHLWAKDYYSRLLTARASKAHKA